MVVVVGSDSSGSVMVVEAVVEIGSKSSSRSRSNKYWR